MIITVKWEDDFKHQVITLKGAVSTRHNNYAVFTDPFY